MATEAYAVCARRTERRDVHVAAGGSYEQEAAAVEEDEEMELEDERGVAKRPDLNELDVPEWAELALDKVEWRKLLHAAAHRPLEMETASRRQSATTRVWGSIGSAEVFSQRAQLTQRQSETCTTLDWPDTGRAWWAWAADGAYAGEWSALPCGSAAPPAERDYPLEKGSDNTHTHTHTHARLLKSIRIRR